MNMLEYLEQDKEGLIRKLEDTTSMEHARKVVCTELDHILLKYNENCEYPLKREAAAYLMQGAKLSSGLIQSSSETRVWEEVNGQEKEKGMFSVKQKIFGGAGVVSGVISMICAIFAGHGETLSLSNLLLAVVLMLVSMVCVFMAGRSISGGNKLSSKNRNYRTENVIDADHIYNCLHNVLYAADQGTEKLLLMDTEEMQKEGKTAGEIAGIPLGFIDFFSGILEAGQMKDGEYALDKIKELRFYLHQNGIEAVEYNGKNKELFDFMPAKGQQTFRPALVSGEKVLKRGLASGGNQ